MKRKMNRAKMLKNLINYKDLVLESLKDPEEARLYLQGALEEYQEDGNAAALLLVLRHIAQARGGLSQLSKNSNLSRQNLYRVLSQHGNPRLDSFGALLKGLGYRLSIEDSASGAGNAAR